jgi:hypothetical protein
VKTASSLGLTGRQWQGTEPSALFTSKPGVWKGFFPVQVVLCCDNLLASKKKILNADLYYLLFFIKIFSFEIITASHAIISNHTEMEMS